MFRLLTRQTRTRTGQATVAGAILPAAPPPPFVYVDAPRVLSLIDGELELVEPEERYVDAQLQACHHPLTKKDMPAQARTTRDGLMTFVTQNPHGHATPDPAHGIAPGYTFWMRMQENAECEMRNAETADPSAFRISHSAFVMAGSISLRLGHNANLDFYLGHIGYHVLPPARGHRFAERACRLLLPLARAHGHSHLWITCNPDNTGSRITCERLGARLVETVAVPRDNPLYSQGDRQKCRYRLEV